MAKGYRPVARDQLFLLSPDMREWLPRDHPVWLVIAAVQRLDTAALHALRRTGGAGAAGFDPDMLVTLLIWAYAHKVTSSRRIEELCRTDIAFRVICAGDAPDHVTIARFRAGLGLAAGALFGQVLTLCARLGMGKLGLVALDGMKIAASASKAANRTRAGLEKLAAELAARHAETDAEEDALFGPGSRGDELPADPRTLDERIGAALGELRAEQAAADEKAARAARDYLARTGNRGQPPAAHREAIAQVLLARAIAGQQAKIEAWHARDAALKAEGKGGMKGRPPGDPASCKAARRARASLAAARAKAARAADARPGRGPMRNLTDPHSRIMPVRGGAFIQGYNTQNVTSSDGLIIATKLTADQNDRPWFEPMLRQAETAAALITASQPARAHTEDDTGGDGGRGIGLILADAGYLSAANLTADGPDRLIATGKSHRISKRATARAGPGDWADPAIAAMAERLTTDKALAAYHQRGHIAETPHGHIKHNMGIRQLSVRGLPRATAEWHLTCAVHNLFKAITSGHLTTATLAALTS